MGPPVLGARNMKPDCLLGRVIAACCCILYPEHNASIHACYYFGVWQNSAVDLNQRMERAKKLVKTTPPRGEEYLRMLQTVLHRESAWTQWKDVSLLSIRCQSPTVVFMNYT